MFFRVVSASVTVYNDVRIWEDRLDVRNTLETGKINYSGALEFEMDAEAAEAFAQWLRQQDPRWRGFHGNQVVQAQLVGPRDMANMVGWVGDPHRPCDGPRRLGGPSQRGGSDQPLGSDDGGAGGPPDPVQSVEDDG